MKKTKNLASKILEYIRRNEQEQEIPEGFKSIEEWMVILKCSRRIWGMILPGMMRSKHAEVAKVKRVKNGRILVFNYYKIDQKFLKGLASR
jgi:hypothetical protein